MASDKVYQIEVFTFKLGQVETAAQWIKEGLPVVSMLGGTMLGAFQAIVGAAVEVLVVIEYPCLQARLDAMAAIRSTGPAQGGVPDFMKKMGDIVQDVKVYYAKASPTYPPSFPVQGTLLVRRYDVVGLPYNAIQDAKGPVAKLVSRGVRMAGAFMPIFGDETSCLFQFWDLPNDKKLDDYVSGMFKGLEDKETKAEVDALFKHVINVSHKAYMPLSLQ